MGASKRVSAYVYVCVCVCVYMNELNVMKECVRVSNVYVCV